MDGGEAAGTLNERRCYGDGRGLAGIGVAIEAGRACRYGDTEGVSRCYRVGAAVAIDGAWLLGGAAAS